MSEERLYKLAHEALLERWSRRYEDVQNYPGYEFLCQRKRNSGTSYLILKVK